MNSGHLGQVWGVRAENSSYARSREKFRTETPESALSALLDRVSRYVSTMPEAISGSHGHNALFRVACVLVNGFAMSDDEALSILWSYNERCQPPWNERELRHKLSEARKVTHQHPRGHLLGRDGKVAPPPPPPRILGRRILKESLRASKDERQADKNLPQVKVNSGPEVTEAMPLVPKRPEWTEEQIRREHRPLWRMDSDGIWHPLNDAAQKLVQASMEKNEMDL
jgi:hypothetical protein